MKMEKKDLEKIWIVNEKKAKISKTHLKKKKIVRMKKKCIHTILEKTINHICIYYCWKSHTATYDIVPETINEKKKQSRN